MMRRGKFGRFAACDKYPDCKTTASLPAGGLIKGTEKICEACTYPLVLVIRKAKKPQEICVNVDCPTKKVDVPVEEKECPKCKKGKMVLRKSLYGSFLGCNKYPKCKNIEQLQQAKV